MEYSNKDTSEFAFLLNTIKCIKLEINDIKKVNILF